MINDLMDIAYPVLATNFMLNDGIKFQIVGEMRLRVDFCTNVIPIHLAKVRNYSTKPQW